MKPILVALDESPRAPSVLAAGLALARKLSARVLLFRAVSLPVELPSEAFAILPAKLPDFLADQALTRLQAIARDVPAELLEGTRVAIGSPWDAVCQAAKDSDASMIVVGSHGYGALDRLLGTTAAKVVNHADRTVVVVRAPERLG